MTVLIVLLCFVSPDQGMFALVAHYVEHLRAEAARHAGPPRASDRAIRDLRETVPDAAYLASVEEDDLTSRCPVCLETLYCLGKVDHAHRLSCRCRLYVIVECTFFVRLLKKCPASTSFIRFALSNV